MNLRAAPLGAAALAGLALAAGAHAQVGTNAASVAMANAAQGISPADWRWQRLPDVSAADGSGLGLRRAACAAATYCSSSASKHGGLVVRIEASAPAAAGKTLQVRSYRQGAVSPFMSRLSSVAADGTFRDVHSTVNYAPGRYAIAHAVHDGQGTGAAVRFDLITTERNVPGTTGGLLPSPKIPLRLASASTVPPVPCVVSGTGGLVPRCELFNELYN